MKTSLVAFIIMVILIVLASNLPDQMASAQAHESGGQSNLVLAAPDNVPTLNPIQQLEPTESQPLLSIESPPLTSVESQPFTSTESLALTSIESQSMPPSPAYSAVYLPITSMTIPPTPTPTPEPTPEPEVQEEIVFTSDEGRSWNDYPGPSIWPDMQAPAPVGILSHPEDQINILLLGSDQRPNDGGFRTDTIQLLTINPSAGTVKLTAFPRDLYVYIPGYTMQRINTAMGWGGFDALANTMEYNFGVRPEYYVLINFSSFKDAIDSIGGITVDVGKDFCDHRDDFGEFCVSQSSYWMNGKTALWYVRARYTTSDLDRGRRQQEVIEAAFNQLISINGLARAPELYDIYKENVDTNVDINLLTNLIPIAFHLAESREISNYSIGKGLVYDWINYSGAMVLVPIREKVLEVMRQVISEP